MKLPKKISTQNSKSVYSRPKIERLTFIKTESLEKLENSK